MQEFIIQPPTNEDGIKTLSFSMAEYIANSAVEDYDRCFYERIAVIEFPKASPIPADPQFISRPFFYAVAQECDRNMTIHLWLHLQSVDFIVSEVRRARPIRFLYNQDELPSVPLPSQAHIKSLFEELLAHPERMFPLYHQPSHWKELS